jgi:intein/homing endonuclease
MNGSQIKAVSAATDAARSEAVSLLIIDEAAFIDNIETIFTAAQQTLATGGGCIALSTPNGMGNWFHQTYTKAQKKENSFLPISLPWTVHPERTQEWRNQQDLDLGIRNAAQECFSFDVRVATNLGFKRISEVEIGDLVLTHKGQYKKVVEKFEKESDDLYSIKTSKNTKQSFVTSNHPFLQDENNEYWKEIKELDACYTFPKYVDVQKEQKLFSIYEEFIPKHFTKVELDENKFFVNDRKHKTVHNKNIVLGYKFGKILGLYLAEGCKNRLRCVYSFNYDKELNTWIKSIQEDVKDVFGIDKFNIRCQGNTGQLSICSEVFCQALDLFVEGDYCHNKKLSNLFFKNGNLEMYKGLLDGYMIGDGMILKKYNKSYITTSEELYYDIAYLSYIVGANEISLKYPKSLFCENKEVMGKMYECKPKFNASFLKTTGKDYDEVYKGGDRKARIIKEKIEEYKCLVYNLEVEDHHSYVTEYGVVHNCDCDFASSGNTFIDPTALQWYESHMIAEPVERRLLDKSYWIWEYPDPMKYYMVVADVARGDGLDSSAFHVIDIESVKQVAEFKAQIGTREYANILVAAATEYNNALLVVEHASIGWDVIQSILERQYNNLYYSQRGEYTMDLEKYINSHDRGSGLVPGFSTNMTTRPLILEKMRAFLESKQATIRSLRLLEELRTFIWKSNKPQAMQGYNDDLVMSFAIAMFLRETSLRFKKTMEDLTHSTLSNMGRANSDFEIYNTNSFTRNEWSMEIPSVNGSSRENLHWLL